MSVGGTLHGTGHANALVAACRHHAEDTPSAIALIDTEGSLSFAALHARITVERTRLHAWGARAGDTIVVRASRDREALITMLALMEIGATYVPVDAASGAESVAWCVRACAGRLFESVPSAMTASISTSNDVSAHANAPPATMAAYGIATSGTTGPPKVVLVSVAAFNAQIEALASLYAIEAADRALHIVSPGFDLALEIVGTSWLRGAALYLPADAHDTERLQAECDRYSVTVVNAPTALVDAWTRRVAAAGGRLPATVRLWVVGSEACPKALPGTLARLALTGARFVNAYGLTETAITSTAWSALPSHMPAQVLPVGHPVGSAIIRVLDDQGATCPPWIAGNIHIGGEALALGYAGDPALTADRFRPDPAGRPGARLFDTRDLGFLDAQGQLFVTGRRDRQLKVRGNRVEPEGVARIIESHTSVTAAVVAGIPLDRPAALAAWVVVRDETALDVLRTDLEPRMQAHEIPRQWSLVDTFPLTTSGKVDIAALAGVAPRTVAAGAHEWDGPRAEAARAAFADAQPDPAVSFIANGGDSMIALALVAALRSRNLKLAPAALWSRAALREVLDDAVEIAADGDCRVSRGFLAGLGSDRMLLHALRDLGDRYHDLSFVSAATALQADMLAASDGGRVAGVYIEHIAGVVAGLDLPRFIKCWEIVTARHDALRTHLVHDRQGRPLLFCLLHHECDWDIEDWRDASVEDADARTVLLINKIQHLPLDARIKPPFRWRVRLLPGDRTLLVWSYHHALLDGWSDAMLLDEAFTLYHGAAENTLPRPGSFRDFVDWIAGRDRGKAQHAWATYLLGLGAARPWMLSDGGEVHHGDAGGTVAMILPPERWKSVLAASRAAQVPVSAVMRDAAAAAIRAVTGADEVVLGLLSTLRPPELPRAGATAGLLLNLLPMRFRPGREDLRSTFESQAALEPHAYLSLSQILDCAPELAAAPLIDTALVFDFFSHARRPEAAVFVAHTRGNLPCTIHVGTTRAFEIVVEHRRDWVSTPRARRLLDAFIEHLPR